MFVVALCVSLCFAVEEKKADGVWTLNDVIAHIQDPPLRDIFESAVHKLAGLDAKKDKEEVCGVCLVQSFLFFLAFFFFFFSV